MKPSRIVVHTDCRLFQGDRPCRPHKERGVHCDGCPDYDPVKEKILVIKLGAVGDVIRTTPLLRRWQSMAPRAQIHWLTHFPEVLPSIVDRGYTMSVQDLEILRAMRFDLLVNLDKDREACALAKNLHARRKKGFILEDGVCRPIDRSAEHKWITGLFDDENRKNTKSYLEEIFEICGTTYAGEEYVLDVFPKNVFDIPRRKGVVGLNTGCGGRWKTRLWPDAHWIRLIRLLKRRSFSAVLLGGEQEDGKNRAMARKSGALYPGHFLLPVFMDLVNRCDLVVTPVTMALHVALGLKKKVVVLNNIFNPREFELFGRGLIVEPEKPCKGCFRGECFDPCMETLLPDTVMAAVEKVWNASPAE